MGYFPDKLITQSLLEVMYGKGKGAPEYWVANAHAGTILFDLMEFPLELAKDPPFTSKNFQ
jgi:large subunit ribosomal protein L16